MKIISFLTILFLYFVLSSCKYALNKKNTSQKYIDIVYHFDKTSDSTFCNPDLIHATDCELGDLYLTKKGYAIYFKYCLGTDSTFYCIGSYLITDSTITCSYDRDFVFAECTECDSIVHKKTNPNSGVLRKKNHNKMILHKLQCNNKIEYFVPPTEEQKQNTIKHIAQLKAIGVTLQPFRGYVFSIAVPKEAADFKAKIRQIHALQDL
jgi:hypothetical protein